MSFCINKHNTEFYNNLIASFPKSKPNLGECSFRNKECYLRILSFSKVIKNIESNNYKYGHFSI